MKVVLLAGGLGTRISEESHLKPKPMIDIGGRPLLWHIMKIYSQYGFRDFIICCGYKGYVIKEYFANYFLHNSDITFDYSSNENKITYHKCIAEPWKVTLVDTGENTMTGGRVARIKEYIPKGEDFMLTYGDGVSNINISKLVAFHKKHRKTATLTSVLPSGRFGALKINEDSTVLKFEEKPKGDNSYINGGFFVLKYDIFNYLTGDDCIFERSPLEQLSEKGELKAFVHDGFWQPVDTLREKQLLEKLWINSAPWKIWD